MTEKTNRRWNTKLLPESGPHAGGNRVLDLELTPMGASREDLWRAREGWSKEAARGSPGLKDKG